MLLEGRTVEHSRGAGATKEVGIGAGGGALVSQASAPFFEAVKRGNVFGGASQSGVTSQAGLSGTTPTLALYNPANSPVDLVLWFAAAVYTVAFATAGAIWLGLHQTGPGGKAFSALGTVLTTTRNLLAGPRLVNQGYGQLLLAGTASTPVGLALLGVGLTGAITTIPAIGAIGRWFNGAVILEPDTAVSIQTGVASGASGQFCEFIWEEVKR